MVVALDDWTRRVMIAPQIVPRTGVAAAFASTPRKAEPASVFKPSVITAMPRRKRPTPPRMEIIVAKTRPPSGRYFINVPVVRNRRESAGVSGCDISAMLPPNVIDGPDAARLPKGLFTSVAHGLLTQGRRMAERNQIRAHDGREKLLGFSAADELERLDREVERFDPGRGLRP